MTWGNAIAGWVAWLVAGAARAATVELRRSQIERLGGEVGRRSPWDVTTADLAAWLAGHGWAVETLRSHRAAVRSFYGWAHASGHIRADPARLLRKVPAAIARPRPASERDVQGAIAAADDRVYLMLLLGSRHGLRRGEIARVHTRDVTEDLVGWSLRVHGKGGKDRDVPLSNETARLLRAAPAGWVFPNGAGSHLSPAHVGRLISRVLPEGVTPHQLRHRFATVVYARTRDIAAVRELLGHASVATTQRYVAVQDGTLRAAVETAA